MAVGAETETFSGNTNRCSSEKPLDTETNMTQIQINVVTFIVIVMSLKTKSHVGRVLYVQRTKAASSTPAVHPLFHTFRENIIILFNYCTWALY